MEIPGVPEFDTVMDEGAEWHIGCGGKVVKDVCIKCGTKRPKGGNIFSRLFSGDFIIEEDPMDKIIAHRMRLRSGRDIHPKGG